MFSSISKVLAVALSLLETGQAAPAAPVEANP